MKEMSLEEKKEWFQSHVKEIALKEWNTILSRDIIKAEGGGVYKGTTAFEGELFEQFHNISYFVKTVRDIVYSYPEMPQTLHKQEWLGCDLSKVHSLIQYNNFETEIICLIKDGKIIEKSKIQGRDTAVDGEKIVKVVKQKINKAAKIGAGVYCVHNHPTNIFASPSTPDLASFENNKTCADEKNVKINFGIVANEDYWDFEQSGATFLELHHKIGEIYKKRKVFCEQLPEMSYGDIIEMIAASEGKLISFEEYQKKIEKMHKRNVKYSPSYIEAHKKAFDDLDRLQKLYKNKKIAK